MEPSPTITEAPAQAEQPEETAGSFTLIIHLLVADKYLFFFFQAEDGIRDYKVTGVQTCALQIAEEVELQQALKRERNEALDEVAALKSTVEKMTQARADATAKQAEAQQALKMPKQNARLRKPMLIPLRWPNQPEQPRGNAKAS